MTGATPATPHSPRVHVLGAGAMGARHVRVFAAAGALVSVEDTLPARALEVAGRVPGALVATLASLAARNEVHLVVVATPTVTHARVTETALAAGAHVLVEKPLASTLRAAESVAEQARVFDRSLLVGMSERFHPVVRALRAQLAARPGASIRSFSSRRFGPGSATQPALLNLGVHDVDLAMHLSRSDLTLREARSQGSDGAQLLLARGLSERDDEPGFTLVCGAATVRERRLVVELSTGDVFRADLLAPRLVLERPGSPPESIDLPAGEPLLLQARAVLAAVGNASSRADEDDSAAVASAEDGLRVLRLVEDAQNAMSSSRPSAPNAAAAAHVAAEKL